MTADAGASVSAPGAPATALATRPAASLCIDCRSVCRGDLCHHDPRHRVLSSSSIDWRDRWMRQVWGPPGARLQARRLVKASGSGAGVGAMLEIGWCADASGIGFLVALGALLFALMYWLVTFVWRNLQAYRKRLKPRGATHRLPRLPAEPALRGRVTEARTNLLSPAGERACVAYAIELCHARHELSEVMLRHSHAAPFAVQLDDGSIAEIGTGRIRIEGVARRHPPGEAVLNNVDLDLERHPDDLPPVPFDSVRETLLLRGDRVALYGDWEREAIDAAGADPYRQAARYRYRPLGVPQIRVLADQQS